MNKYSPLIFTLSLLLIASCGKEQQPAVSATPLFNLVETPVGDVHFPVS